MAQAIAIIDKKPVRDAETKRLSTFLDTFSRMGRKEKLLALQALSQHLPASVSIDFAANKLEAAE
jgi:hypothetical protein